MGLRDKATQAVGDAAHTYAAEAHRSGVPIYCPVLPKPSAFAAGMAVDSWALAIDAIEAAGWHLEQWAIDPSGNARPVFRRVVDETLASH